KHVLGGDVADVRSSSNLETSLARLVANESGMDPQMERMMRMHNPDFQGGPKVLEVNAKHPLVKALNSKVEAGDFAASDSFARLLYDSAVVAEGEPIADPRDFTNRITAVMEAALGATK
ncbi:MAG: molecular chaperone HtpG, partial [Pseudomonadota bacterium]|nr:molecular chaperone HtpG [Pseudomonadota bacterium]